MRFFILLLIGVISLYAKDSESCHTVQLQSAIYSQTNLDKLKNSNFPSECTLMRISNVLTIRCGCYDNMKQAKKELPKYQKRYKYAYVATSYKFRFKKDSKIKTQLKHKTRIAYNGDEELKLMLQAFLYSKDLDHAYETAKIGYTRHPNSYYWNQKMLEVCQWSGRSNEAIKYMKFIYKKNHSSKLAKQIIDYGLGSYQYDQIKDMIIEEAKKNPSKINIDRLIYITDKVGEPEVAAKILKNLYKQDNNRIDLLNKALQIYMEMENLEEAQKIITMIENNNLYNLENVKLISYYYYSEHNISKAYDILTKLPNNTRYDEKYLQLKSDLGWYLQHFNSSSLASLKLINHKDSRLVDCERVTIVYKKKNKPLAQKTILEAYNKFNSTYLFYTFTYQLLRDNDMKMLKDTIRSFDMQENRKIQKESQYWLIKAQLYNYEGKRKLTRRTIEKAIRLQPNSLQIKLMALNLFQEYNMTTALHKELVKLTTDISLSSESYFPLAALAYDTNNINLSNYYMQKLIDSKNHIIDTLEFKFLQADIYNARNNYNAYLNMMREIDAQLHQEAQINPKLKNKDKYLNYKLRAELNLISSDSFKKLLEESKPYLSKQHYNDLNYAIASKNNEKSKTHAIYVKTKKKPIWMQFSNALDEENHTQIENLLFAYLRTIPFGAASYAAKRDGQIALSQSLDYQSLYNNNDNQNAYISMLNLTKLRSDVTNLKISYKNITPLLREYTSINNSNYLDRGYYLISKLNFYKNINLDKKILDRIPNNTIEAQLGIKKDYDRLHYYMLIGHTNGIAPYFMFSLFGKYKITKVITLAAGIYKNAKADESTQLLLAGKKDKLELKTDLDIMNSVALELLYNYNIYNTQNNKHIGEGNYLKVNLSKQIHNGYPDMRVSVFTDGAFYNEKSGNKGTIDKIHKVRSKILPNDFANIGFNFAYGMTNSEIYTRVWRPYLEISTYYNTDMEDFSYGFNAGYGGKVYSQDHLVLGVSYTDAVNGVGGSILELFLNYKFLYTHR